MHAIYCFLINEVEDDPEDMGPVSEYLETRTDENNWYEPCLKVRENGDIVQLASDGDWRGRDGWYGEYEKIPKEDRWAEVLKLAKGCVCSEIESAMHCISGDYKYELPADMPLSEVHAECERYLKLYSDTEHDRKSMYWYGVEKLGKAMGQLEYMHDNYPFSGEDLNPYETVRAIDFRETDYDEKNNKIIPHLDNLAVVLVDIHT